MRVIIIASVMLTLVTVAGYGEIVEREMTSANIGEQEFDFTTSVEAKGDFLYFTISVEPKSESLDHIIEYGIGGTLVVRKGNTKVATCRTTGRRKDCTMVYSFGVDRRHTKFSEFVFFRGYGHMPSGDMYVFRLNSDLFKR